MYGQGCPAMVDSLLGHSPPSPAMVSTKSITSPRAAAGGAGAVGDRRAWKAPGARKGPGGRGPRRRTGDGGPGKSPPGHRRRPGDPRPGVGWGVSHVSIGASEQVSDDASGRWVSHVTSTMGPMRPATCYAPRATCPAPRVASSPGSPAAAPSRAPPSSPRVPGASAAPG